MKKATIRIPLRIQDNTVEAVQLEGSKTSKEKPSDWSPLRFKEYNCLCYKRFVSDSANTKHCALLL